MFIHAKIYQNSEGVKRKKELLDFLNQIALVQVLLLQLPGANTYIMQISPRGFSFSCIDQQCWNYISD